MSRLWIFVVDDQEPVRDLIADILVAEGHYVRTFENSARSQGGVSMRLFRSPVKYAGGLAGLISLRAGAPTPTPAARPGSTRCAR